MVGAGELPGGVNLGAEVKHNGDGIETTYRILRNAKEKSYGHIQSETMGITRESLRAYLLEEIAQNIYPPRRHQDEIVLIHRTGCVQG
jgi:hypothetical protein